MTGPRDSLHSTQRELLIEHFFVGELMKQMWLRSFPNLEASKPQADKGGYDLVLESGRVIRHVQIKSSGHGARVVSQKVNVKLASKPSGCVVWVRFEPENLDLGPFLRFGGTPNQPLPSLSHFRVAKHTKGNAEGRKAERPNIRVVPKSHFTSLATIDDVIDRLFGVASPIP
jgi:hypothetical protein